MEWSKAVNDALTTFHLLPERELLLTELLPFWDVTNLHDISNESSLKETFSNAQSQGVYAPVVCVYPKWVPLAVSSLAKTSTHVATVVNFPKGDALLQAVGIQIEEALSDGATEIDVVFPYQSFLAGEEVLVAEFVSYCKSLCDDVLLKVILETGVMQAPSLIAEATQLAARAGADFIKTSTGKVAVGATFEAATAILLAINEVRKHCPQAVGLKVSGGIRTLQEASRYYALSAMIMSEKWMSPRHFRIGASKLL